MSDSLTELQHRIFSAGELKSVVRTMKSIAASNIAQYERAVEALDAYHTTIRHGLAVALRYERLPTSREGGPVGVVLFGSDHGLVGQFNEAVADFSQQALHEYRQVSVWVAGDALASRLDAALPSPVSVLAMPGALSAITAWVGQLLARMEDWFANQSDAPVLVIYQSLMPKAICQPTVLRLLPLDEQWRQSLLAAPWQGKRVPELLGGVATLQALLHEYLFVSLYRACAESLASENASRLAAMQRADKNIDEMLDDLRHNRQRVRQSNIDEELFDVLAGFEAQMEGGWS